MRVALIAALMLAVSAALAQSKRADLPKTHRSAVQAAERAAAARAATSAPAEAEPLCPVTGRAIDRQIWTEFRGKKVYFADEAAREKFIASPYDYSDAVKAQWEAMRPLRVQVLCPVSGKPVDNAISAEWQGETIYFATPEARRAWEQDPQRYAGKLDGCYTFQTLCLCGMGEIRPDVSLEYKGRTLYFCCPSCRAEFERNPDELLKQSDERTAANKLKWEQQHPVQPTPAEPPAPAKP